MSQFPNFDDDIAIDAESLDVEWLNQAPLSRKYGKLAAQQRKIVAQLEERKKTIRSQLIKEANQDPKKCTGKEKPNAADLESYYRDHSRYKEVIEELIEAQFELDNVEDAKNEIAYTRKAALSNLVVLHGQQYFAGPSVPRDLKEEVRRFKERQQKTVDAGISKVLRRTKKSDQ